MEPSGNRNFNFFLVDEKVRPLQHEALRAIGNDVLMGDGSTNREVRKVPLTRVTGGAEHETSPRLYGSFSRHRVEGGLGGPSKIVTPPGANPPDREYAAGTTTNLSNEDAGRISLGAVSVADPAPVRRS